MAISPTITFRGLDEARAALGDQIINRAISSTINKVATQTRTAISKEVRTVYNVKAKAVKDATTLRRARVGDNEAFVFGTGKRIPLRDFGARQTRIGVTVKVKKAGGRKRLPSAFVVQSIGGNVFLRETRRRLPIRKLVGPAIPQMITSPDVIQRILDNAETISPRIFESELQFRIRRALGR